MERSTLDGDGILVWSERHAAVPRDLPARPDLPHRLGRVNVAEEIEDAGIARA